VIGDPDQAIYGFRGADVGFFLRFGRDYAGARTVQLTRNYRSSPAIVTSAMAAVTPVTLVPGRSLSAVARVPGQRGGSRRRGSQSAPAQITVHEAADEHAEAAWIAQAIDQVLGGVSLHSLDSGRADGHAGGKIGLADIAVLYRTDAQAGPLTQALTRAGLPFQKRSHDLLSRRSAVPDIVHEMRMAEISPRPGGPAGSHGAGGARRSAVTVTNQLYAAVGQLAHRELAGPVPDAGAPDGSGAGRVTSPVDVLAAGEVLAPLARRCGSDLEQFLTEITLGAEADALDPRADAVPLLTLHAAKGLEFSVVFVAGCERGLLPLWLPGSGGPDSRGPDVAEERRLLFVGMTRARTHLFLTCAKHRRRYGTVAETGPSPFLTAIDPALVDRSVPRPRRPATQQLRLL
jgi:DNA helicase II / ATP-dependent DNA helicase PcrA